MSTSSSNEEMTLEEFRRRVAGSAKEFVFPDPEKNTEDFVHFCFAGVRNGTEVLYDAAMYTLRLHHRHQILEFVEEQVVLQFPEYAAISAGEDENHQVPEKRLEEIGMFIAELVVQTEEEEEIKVQEHVEIDEGSDGTIGLDIGLNLEAITAATIEKFIREFNAGTLSLDKTLYAFQTGDDDTDD